MKTINYKQLAFLSFLIITFLFPFSVQGDEITVYAKGTKAKGGYAHFKVFVNGNEIGNSYTTEEYKSYSFQCPTDLPDIIEISIWFHNDLYEVPEDRNLFIRSIKIGNNALIAATNETVTYISDAGYPQEYNGMMGWDGELIFKFASSTIGCDQYVRLSSQEDVNAFQCQIINGNLTISGSDITDLSPLGNLEQVKGKLLIKSNPILTNLNGLDNLKSCTAIIIEKNPNLLSIHEFTSCIFSTLDIRYNVRLEKISGFDSVSDRINGISIYSNLRLKTIEGFNSIKECVYIQINKNWSLKEIHAFNGLVSFYELDEGGLSISDNFSLQVLYAFNSLKTCWNSISISDHYYLEHLPDFSSLAFVRRSISISRNYMLKSIDGFNNLRSSYEVNILSNNNLKSINGFNSYSEVDKGVFTINNNPRLETINCLSAIGRGTIIIEDNNSLKHIIGPNTEPYEISIGLKISNNPILENINGLMSMTKASIILSDNTALTNVYGLENLNEASLTIENNPSLTSFCGLFPLIQNGEVRKLEINNNGIEITRDEILDNGPCELENGIIVSAKGTRGNGEYARFKVYSNNTLLGESYTSTEYNNYRFSLPYDAGRIDKARVVFNNDYSSSTEDRNLFVEYVEINGLRFDALPNEVTYIRDWNWQEIYYDGVMPWNGQLIFDINYALASAARTESINFNENLLDEFKHINIELYPNPAGQFINLELSNITPGQIQFYLHDFSGMVVGRYDFDLVREHEIKTFDISKYPDGIYVLKLITSDNQYLYQKLIIE